MKKRLLCFLLTAALMLGMVTGLASSAQAATQQQKTRAIAIVFDNSGSMYGTRARWCQATYAMEVFASMMNEDDQLLIYPMHEIKLGYTGDKIASLTIKGPSEAPKIREIYTPRAGGTPFTTVTEAYNGLLNTTADEKYLIVLTDGAFDNGNMPVTKVEDYLDAYSKDVNVMFLGIEITDGTDGPDYMPDVHDSARQFYKKVDNSAEVLSALTEMSNRIFGRKELSVNNDAITFDVSMSKVIVFIQGKGIQDVTLSGGNKISEHTPKYSEYGSNEGSVADYTLQGMLVTYENLDAGTYSISYTGNKSNISVYYEPNVDLSIQLIDSDNLVADTSGDISAGEYTLKYGLVDKDGNFTDSELLGEQKYEITYIIDGVPTTVTDDGDGEVTLTLEAGSTLDGEFIVQYLDDYTIKKDGEALGWPEGGLNIVRRSVGDVKIQVTGGLDSYVLSTLEQDAVYQISIYHDGELLTGEDLDDTTLDAVLTGGNAQVTQTRTDSGYTVTVGYNGDAPSTDCGEYNLTFTVTYTLDDSGQDTASKVFTITDDSTALGAALEIVQDYYEIPNLSEAQPLYLNLTMGGLPMDAETFNGTSVDIDIPGVTCDVQPDPANSRYVIYITDNGQIEPGRYTVTATVSAIDEIGRAVSVQDTAKIELQNYPAWLRILIYILIALLILALIWMYLNTKILPKLIGVGPCTFIVDGNIVAGSAKCVYTGKNKRRGTLTVQSPHYGANPAAKCGYTLELEAESPRRVRSSARSVKVVAVRPMSASSTIAVQIGGTNLSKDPVSGKLMKAGGKPGAPLTFKIGNKAKTSVTAEVMDMANGGGEVTVSMSVPLKFY